jgi:hypothetical protein
LKNHLVALNVVRQQSVGKGTPDGRTVICERLLLFLLFGLWSAAVLCSAAFASSFLSGLGFGKRETVQTKAAEQSTGRVAVGITAHGSHRSGLAQLRHPARCAVTPTRAVEAARFTTQFPFRDRLQ